MCVCVWRCGHACSACVWCVVGIVWGGCGVCGWAMGGVVADPPHPTMAISSMHGWGWGVVAVASAVGACGCAWVVRRRAGACGAASQAHLRSAAPSRAASAHPHARALRKKGRLQTPQSAALFGTGGDHIPTRCCGRGGTHLCLRVRRILRGWVFLAPVTTGQRPQAARHPNCPCMQTAQ